jgi:hypothetical protein
MSSVDVRISSDDGAWPERRYQLSPEPATNWWTFFAAALRSSNMAGAGLNPATRVERLGASHLRVTNITIQSSLATNKFVTAVVSEATRQAHADPIEIS